MADFCLDTMLSVMLTISSLASISIAYAPIVNKLQEYIESDVTFALMVNETLMEAGYGPNSLSHISYSEVYTFWDDWITMAPMYNDSFFQTVRYFALTKTGFQLFSTHFAKQWILEWQIQRKKYCDSYNSTRVT